MIKRTISAREKKLVLIAAAAVAAALLFQFALSPLIDRYVRVNKEIKTFEKKNKKFRQFEKNPALNAGDAESGKLVFKGFLEVLSAIEELTRKGGVEILEMRPDTDNIKPMKSYKQVLVNLRVRGPAASVSGFLYEMDSAFSSFRIERLSVGSKGDASTLEASLAISGFYSEESPATPNP